MDEAYFISVRQLVLLPVPHRNLAVKQTLKKNHINNHIHGIWKLELELIPLSVKQKTFALQKKISVTNHKKSYRFGVPPPPHLPFFKKGVMIYSYTHYIWIPILKHPNQVLKSDSRAGTPLSQAYVLASTRSFTAKVSSTRGRKGTRGPRALFSPRATTTCYLWPFKKLSCSLKNLFGYLRCRTFQLLPILEFHLLLLAHLVTKLTFLKT